MPEPLFPDPSTCVVCFHEEHTVPCESLDDYWPPDTTPMPCGCDEYVTEAERGERLVVVEPGRTLPPGTHPRARR